MNTIAILRTKGLSYTEIMEIIDERQGKQLVDAYNKGVKDGIQGLLSVMQQVVEYSEMSNKDLSC